MRIPAEAIRIAQRGAGLKGNQVDGILGPVTEAALDKALKRRKQELAQTHAEAVLKGSRRRKVTAFIQLLALDAGIDTGPVDGYWGPQTDFAFTSLRHLETEGSLPPAWRDIEPSTANPNGWPMEREADLTQFYGPPGTEANLVLVDAPYPHRLSWDLAQTARRIRCHAKVADSLQRVLTAVLDHYGLDGVKQLHLDRFGGCYKKRRKRGGTAWSTHAWGIALDYDPERNQLRWGRDRAVFAQPAYDKWWECWENEGWVSLGRTANFDWMHVQAARRS